MIKTIKKYGKVSAQPVKRFFVEMLTRDIGVEDAILDLLDNCVDGILRKTESEEAPKVSPPYQGFWAKITVNRDRFEIKDNCGGIPWSEHERAFRMGRPPLPLGESSDPPKNTVGVYGIGMKRAIFKMGDNALISTKNGEDGYQISISPDWMKDESEWALDVQPVEDGLGYEGTTIAIDHLHDGISERFSSKTYTNDLLDRIQSHYAVIIDKGFTVEVNGKTAVPVPIHLRFAPYNANGREIRPYVFEGEENGIDVFVAVGLREPIPSIEDTLKEQREPRFSTDYAGWTVICNDRVVLYCNRDELTGWGTAGVPRYHTQFIAISGVVEFRGAPDLLPTTTTKRGLDVSASIYQRTLERMREGILLFTSFTNEWKTREEEAKATVSPVPTVAFSELRIEAQKLPLRTVRSGLPGRQFKPHLPLPPTNTTDVRISFSREQEQVWELGDALIAEFSEVRDKEKARQVGIASFEYAYKKLVEDADETEAS